MPTTTTQTLSCACCTPTCPGCTFRSPLPCTLHVLMSATGIMAPYDGCSGTATNPGGVSHFWRFIGDAASCTGNPSPCGAGGRNPAYDTEFLCGTLGGVGCLVWGGNAVGTPGFGAIGDCTGANWLLDGSTGETLTSVSYTPFHEVLVMTFLLSGTVVGTITLDITE